MYLIGVNEFGIVSIKQGKTKYIRDFTTQTAILVEKAHVLFITRPKFVSVHPGYTPKLDPRVANAFGTAAYRFGHTLIQDRIRRTSYDFEHDDSLMLSMVSTTTHFINSL